MHLRKHCIDVLLNMILWPVAGIISTTSRVLDREKQEEHALEVSIDYFPLFLSFSFSSFSSQAHTVSVSLLFPGFSL